MWKNSFYYYNPHLLNKNFFFFDLPQTLFYHLTYHTKTHLRWYNYTSQQYVNILNFVFSTSPTIYLNVWYKKLKKKRIPRFTLRYIPAHKRHTFSQHLIIRFLYYFSFHHHYPIYLRFSNNILLKFKKYYYHIFNRLITHFLPNYDL